jgi:hypothetical protein
MVSKPGLAQLIMAILFRFKPALIPYKQALIPLKNFADEQEAKNWLSQYL